MERLKFILLTAHTLAERYGFILIRDFSKVFIVHKKSRFEGALCGAVQNRKIDLQIDELGNLPAFRVCKECEKFKIE